MQKVLIFPLRCIKLIFFLFYVIQYLGEVDQQAIQQKEVATLEQTLQLYQRVIFIQSQ